MAVLTSLHRSALSIVTAACVGVVLVACGGGDDSAASTAPVTPPPLGGSPPPAVATLKLYPARLSLGSDQQAAIAAVHAASAVNWSSSDAGIASVDANGVVSAVGRGSAIITASDGTTSAAADVQVYVTAGATLDTTSESLIAQALAAGNITAEQSLVYRVQAFFNDAQLPVAYRGAPDPSPHSSALRDAAAGYNGFSAATQAALLPYLLPPIYAESWFGQQNGAVSSQKARIQGGRLAAPQISCTLESILELHTTAHFNIWTMPTDIGRLEGTYIASVIEGIYKTETDLVKRFPLPDTDLPCSGGDGATDIYVFPMSGIFDGQTLAYPGRCEETPAYIVLNDVVTSMYFSQGGFDPAATQRMIKGVLAHELLHTLQFGMKRAAACADYNWIDEATATAVIDIVDPTLNTEDGVYKRGVPGSRSGSFYVDYLLGGHMNPIEQPSDQVALNGYGDYIFFQFLQRKYGNAVLKNLFDSWTTNGSVASLDAALVASGTNLKNAWPAFALALWNDTTNKVQNDLQTWDFYDWGMAYVFDFKNQDGYTRRQQTLAIDQKGSGRASFDLLGNASVFGGTASFAIPPRSMFFEHLVFSDPTVNSVLIENPIAITGGSGDTLRLQAVMKVGGTWKDAADWSKDQQKFFCFDKADERLQELVLFVSNSAVVSADQPATYGSDTPLRISTSNVGCGQWKGTASVHTVSDNGVSSADTTARAVDVVFEAGPDSKPGTNASLVATSGTVSGDSLTATTIPAGCHATLTAAPVTLGAQDGLLVFGRDLKSWGELSPNRDASILMGFSILSTSVRTVCLGNDTTNVTQSGWAWLGLPPQLLPVAVSSDGRTLEANLHMTDPTGKANVVYTFTFTAIRE